MKGVKMELNMTLEIPSDIRNYLIKKEDRNKGYK